MVVGANADDDSGDESGSAYVFVRSAGVWSQDAKLTASDGTAGDDFGYSVAISGTTVVIGAPLSGNATGSAYVFVRTESGWVQQAKLTALDGDDEDQFGTSVAVTGPLVAIGAKFDDDAGSASGSAYIFARGESGWSQQAKLTADDGAAVDLFGVSVSITSDGPTVVVGASRDDDVGHGSGSVYVFVPTGSGWTEWTQQAKLIADDGSENASFGNSVSVFGGTVAVGAPADDNSGLLSGSAYVFVRTGSSWSQEAKLTPSDGAEGDSFGFSVSVSADIVVVGALGDDDSGELSGSAYVFTPTQHGWLEREKLTASDGEAHKEYGISVDVSGTTVLVGAPGLAGSAYTNSCT
jgi:hypothetical protein